MSTPIVSVRNASHTSLGFGRIHLEIATPAADDYVSRNCAKRTLTAAAYSVAARLEQIGAGDGLEFELSVSKASAGIITVDFRSDNFDSYAIDEVLIEACADCGFEPTDMLVEAGIIVPSDADCGDGPFGQKIERA